MFPSIFRCASAGKKSVSSTNIAAILDFACDIDLCPTVCHEVKVSMPYISWSIDFASFIEAYLMDEHLLLSNVSVWHNL